MAKKNDLFIVAKEKQVVVSFKAPESLKKRSDEVNEKLQKLKPEMAFSLSAILLREMRDAVELAEQELDAMGSRVEGNAGASPAGSSRVANDS